MLNAETVRFALGAVSARFDHLEDDLWNLAKDPDFAEAFAEEINGALQEVTQSQLRAAAERRRNRNGQ